MRRFFFIFKALIIATIAFSIAGCSSTKEVSQADIDRHNEAVRQLIDREFVVKADRLVLAKHTFNSISPFTNFIMVNGDKATVQVSPGHSGGPNGVGGFTVNGNITGYEVETKSNGSVKVRFNVNALAGSCSVYISIPKDSDNATATIHSTFRGSNATIYGDVSQIDNSFFVGYSKYN